MKFIARLSFFYIFIVFLNLYFIFEYKLFPNVNDSLKCSQFPLDEDLIVDHEIWQVLTTPKGKYKIMNAYVDDRDNETIIRVLMAGTELDILSDEIYCQFWFDDSPNGKSFVQKATEYFIIWAADTGAWTNETLLPQLIKCPIEYNGGIPKYVSLTPKPCIHATNRMKVIDNKPKNGIKKNFVLTTKALTYEDRSYVIRFIEWVEMMRILGCDKIDVFVRSVHPDVTKMLNYYENQGFIEVHRWQEPEEVKHHTYDSVQNFMLQMMQHTDCFFRTRNLYKYIVVLDTDEVIVPMRSQDRTWNDLVERRYDVSSGIVSFMSWNTIVDSKAISIQPDAPDYLYMMHHHQRAQVCNNLVKTIMVGDRILSVYLHGSEFCLGGIKCPVKFASKEDSLTFHYRSSFLWPKDNVTIEDTTMLKYKVELVRGVELTLNETGFRP